MLAILELPDKTAHKGLSCFSSNKVASKQHQRRHQWRPPSRRLARTRDRWLAPYHGTTAACGCRGAPPLRLRAYQPAPPGRAGPMKSILSIGVQTTQTTRLLNVHANRSSYGFHGSTDPHESAASHQYARAERHLTPRVADDAGISLG